VGHLPVRLASTTNLRPRSTPLKSEVPEISVVRKHQTFCERVLARWQRFYPRNSDGSS
jgi:hypothetical protein